MSTELDAKGRVEKVVLKGFHDVHYRDAAFNRAMIHHFPHDKQTMTAASVHLDDADEENGCIHVIPESHKKGPACIGRIASP